MIFLVTFFTPSISHLNISFLDHFKMYTVKVKEPPLIGLCPKRCQAYLDQYFARVSSCSTLARLSFTLHCLQLLEGHNEGPF